MQHDLRLAQPFLTRVGTQVRANCEFDELFDVDFWILRIATRAATKGCAHDEQQVRGHGSERGRGQRGSYTDHTTKALKEAEPANGTTRKLACEFAFE